MLAVADSPFKGGDFGGSVCVSLCEREKSCDAELDAHAQANHIDEFVHVWTGAAVTP